jgi:hypothetical protein
MSHSTHVGLSGPYAASGSVAMTPESFDVFASARKSTFAPVSFQSRAVGVGQCGRSFAACPSSEP